MSGESVILAAEDTLGEVVSIRILASLDIGVSQRLGLRGKGYLQNKADGLNRTAQGFPVFMLTDQDTPQSVSAAVGSILAQRDAASTFLPPCRCHGSRVLDYGRPRRSGRVAGNSAEPNPERYRHDTASKRIPRYPRTAQ